MVAVEYPFAFTVTLLGFSPGAGVCNQIPLMEPFWLLYPDSAPPHPGLGLLLYPMVGSVALCGPLLPLPELGLVLLAEPPHPLRNKTSSATVKTQREEGKSLIMRYSR